MISHRMKTSKVVSNEPVRFEIDHKDMRVLKLEFVDADGLSIVDDYDTGGDPYNTAGQHLVIKSRIDIED